MEEGVGTAGGAWFHRPLVVADSSAVSYVILRMGSIQPQKSALSPSTSAWGMAVAMS